MLPVALAGAEGMLDEAEADGVAGLLDGEELVVELQAASAMTASAETLTTLRFILLLGLGPPVEAVTEISRGEHALDAGTRTFVWSPPPGRGPPSRRHAGGLAD